MDLLAVGLSAHEQLSLLLDCLNEEKRITMKTHFFPRYKQFWSLHLGLTFFIAALQMIEPVVWNAMNATVLRHLTYWIVFFTAVVLLFRWLCKQYQSRKVALPKLIAMVGAYSLIFGFLIATSVIYLEFAVLLMINSAFQVPPTKDIFGGILFHGLKNQVLICVWVFLYFSVTSSRRAKEAELISLKLQSSLKEAQMSNLSNQLNPHFLFNSLNNIRFMIYEDQKKADYMITSLSDILRYTLESSKQEKVRLQEEVEVINRYVEIVSAQMEDRLFFTLSMPQNLNDYLIPPMVLQMLVENAVKHGLDHIPTRGNLDISIFDLGDQLAIEINNDIPDELRHKVPSTGIGLKNIKKRLYILYGDLASISTQKTETHFTVSMFLPKELLA